MPRLAVPRHAAPRPARNCPDTSRRALLGESPHVVGVPELGTPNAGALHDGFDPVAGSQSEPVSYRDTDEAGGFGSVERFAHGNGVNSIAAEMSSLSP